jgi:dolichol kinase
MDNREWMISAFLIALLLIAGTWALGFKLLTNKSLKEVLLRDVGVAAKRIARLIKELRRKTFHLMGLLIPVIYFFGIKYIDGFNQNLAAWIMGIITTIYWMIEFLRYFSATFQKLFQSVFAGILRQKESSKFTGMGFYLLGNTLAISLFPPLIGLTSMLYLILGDLCAALVGISFGKIKISSHKSLEGTLAMFFICFVITIIMFWRIPFFEYVAFIGAASACLIELLEFAGLDDNLTITFGSALALQFAIWRIQYGLQTSAQSELQFLLKL